MSERLIEKMRSGEISCEVELVLAAIGGKWKAVILYHLGMNGTLRYGQLSRLVSKATPKMLIGQLRELEEDGLVLRREYHQIPPKVEYSLTEKGQTLLPILGILCQWGREHIMGETGPRQCAATPAKGGALKDESVSA